MVVGSSEAVTNAGCSVVYLTGVVVAFTVVVVEGNVVGLVGASVVRVGDDEDKIPELTRAWRCL